MRCVILQRRVPRRSEVAGFEVLLPPVVGVFPMMSCWISMKPCLFLKGCFEGEYEARTTQNL